MDDFQRRIILQGFTGAQPIVVLAFIGVRAAMCIEDLQRETGRSPDALTPAVKALEGKGLLVRQTGAHGKVYYLPSSASFYGLFGGQIPVFAESENQNPGFAESGSVVVAVDQVSLPLQQLTTTTTNKAQTPGKPESAPSEFERENLVAFKDLGIFGKRPREVARLPWVNPDYIRAHVAYARSLEWATNPEGYALEQMTSEVPAPATPEGKKEKYQVFVPGGKGRLDELITYEFDLLGVIADFTGHKRGCNCRDCQMGRALHGQMDLFCSDCKHYYCECPDEEGAGDA
jgi:hypothetical protein